MYAWLCALAKKIEYVTPAPCGTCRMYAQLPAAPVGEYAADEYAPYM